MKNKTPKEVEERWLEQVTSREDETLEKDYAKQCIHDVLDTLIGYYKDFGKSSDLIETVRLGMEKWMNSLSLRD